MVVLRGAGVVVALASLGCGACTGGGTGTGGDGRAAPGTAEVLSARHGSALEVTYPGSTEPGCDEVVSTDLEESAESVVITIATRTTKDCNANIVTATSRVDLTDPLDGRDVIDGSTGDAVPVGDSS